MSEHENIRYRANLLAGYAATCEMKNTLLWMEGLAKHINGFLESIGDGDRVTTHGYGLQTITAEELSTLDEHGYKKQ